MIIEVWTFSTKATRHYPQNITYLCPTFTHTWRLSLAKNGLTKPASCTIKSSNHGRALTRTCASYSPFMRLGFVSAHPCPCIAHMAHHSTKALPLSTIFSLLPHHSTFPTMKEKYLHELISLFIYISSRAIHAVQWVHWQVHFPTDAVYHNIKLTMSAK